MTFILKVKGVYSPREYTNWASSVKPSFFNLTKMLPCHNQGPHFGSREEAYIHDWWVL